jgi:primosomal protein N' (replication factor Y)
VNPFVDIALPVPLPDLFTYRLPEGVEPAAARPGMRVRVHFGRQVMVGVIMGPADPAKAARMKTRALSDLLDPEPLIGPNELALARWLSDYWLAPPGEAVSLLLPPRMADGAEAPALKSTLRVRLSNGAPPSEPAAPEPSGKKASAPKLGPKMTHVIQWLAAHGEASADTVRAATGASLDSLRRLAERGLVELTDETRFRDPLAGNDLANLRTASTQAHPLTPAQAEAVREIEATFGTYRGFLLHGVTGSGKTEVYLALIESVLARGQGALVLVPEIALTPQLVSRFRVRLGERVAVQHSGLDPLARHEQWLRIRSGELPVVVGARSALFAPVAELGLVIVDEEHEPSFKQETSPRYHARDLALVRGHLAKVPVVLGSATPSLESWANVAKKKLVRLSLPERAHQNRPLPLVEVVDLRSAPMALVPRGAGPSSPGSPRGRKSRLVSLALCEALIETVKAGEQAIVFLNRRGYASAIQCLGCGEPLVCPSCSVSLTWHRQRGRLVCHYCDETRPMPRACPKCQSPELGEIGAGTEHIEEELGALVPGARLGRMDKDTTRGKALIKLLGAFRKREIDILIGTQMVAKGHDFPGVTLVGVLSAEHGLAFPDFRAAERTFQLLTQIAGRAGRGERVGRVLVQTHLPEHYAIRYAVTHDVTGFLDREQELRDARGFPPSSHLALFRVAGPDEGQTATVARALEKALAEAAGSSGSVAVQPAQPAPIERIKDRWRYQVLVRAGERRDLRALLEATRGVWAGRQPHGILVALDVDPIQFL